MVLFKVLRNTAVSMIPRMLSKVTQDETEGIVVVPFWPNQVCYPVISQVLIYVPTLIDSRRILLQ